MYNYSVLLGIKTMYEGCLLNYVSHDAEYGKYYNRGVIIIVTR